MNDISAILHVSPVIPVVTLRRADDALALADALLEGGVRIVEITFRTSAAQAAINEIARKRPEMIVGAGTLWSEADLRAALEAGAHFGVSPGATKAFLAAVATVPLPFLPGAATPSEVADRVEHGFAAVKLFPAGPVGGPAALKALASVFPSLDFCPTGGISEADAPDYLSITNVPVVGGSWIAPPDLVDSGRWDEISALAQRAVALC